MVARHGKLLQFGPGRWAVCVDGQVCAALVLIDCSAAAAEWMKPLGSAAVDMDMDSTAAAG